LFPPRAEISQSPKPKGQRAAADDEVREAALVESDER
jgi:hypothetical protein